jgi:hypothetical protein
VSRRQCSRECALPALRRWRRSACRLRNLGTEPSVRDKMAAFRFSALSGHVRRRPAAALPPAIASKVEGRGLTLDLQNMLAEAMAESGG